MSKTPPWDDRMPQPKGWIADAWWYVLRCPHAEMSTQITHEMRQDAAIDVDEFARQKLGAGLRANGHCRCADNIVTVEQ
jgi:hypothetical protein